MLSSQLDLTLATIYLAMDAALPERYAAEELSSHLKQITGKDFPVKELPADEGTPAILLGRNAATERLLPGFDWSMLQEDGVLVKTAGNALILAGATPRGTLYAVYQFLDQVLGCRWLTPEYSVIPRRDELVVGELDIVYTPVFRYREAFFSAVWSSGDWLARNRANNSMGALEEKHGGKWVYAGFAHTFYPLVPPEKYFAEHPEYYSEINGQRVYMGAQLCLTNEELVDVMCDNIRAEMKKTPEARIISVTQNDWNGWCQCEKCRAIDEAEGSQSGTMLYLVNKVAERLEAEFPQVFFDTFAYTYTVRPPKTIRPRKNVVVRLCHITPCCDAHPMAECEHNRWFYEVLQGWSELAPELYIWDYYNNFHHNFQPYPNLDAIAKDIKLFSEHHVTGVFVQGDSTPPKGCGDMAELRAWVMSRLLWNPTQDAWALVDEFLQLYYGPAAPFIREYLDALHAPARMGGNHFHLYQDLESPAVAGDAIPRYVAIFEQAEKMVAHDPVLLDRVKAARLPLEYITWKRDLRYAMRGDRYEPESRELANRLRSFFELAAAHGAKALRERGTPLAEMRSLAEGYDVIRLGNGQLQIGVIPGIGGRLVSLRDGETEWLHQGEVEQLDYPVAGGYEEYSEHQWRTPGWNENYQVEEQSAHKLTMSATLENGFTLQRTYRLGTDEDIDRLFITSTISNNTDQPRSGCYRSMPEFLAKQLEGAVVRFRQQDGDWRESMPWQSTDAAFGSGWVQGDEKPWGVCRYIRDGRALTMHFDPQQAEKVLFDWDRSLGFLRFGLCSAGFMLQPGESFTVIQEWQCE